MLQQVRLLVATDGKRGANRILREVWLFCNTIRHSRSCNLNDGIAGARVLAQNAHCEQTIRSDIEFHGIGLHSGAEVSMRLVAAPAGSGIVFRRTDLDNFEIPATGRNVAKVSYATSLMRQSVLDFDDRALAVSADRVRRGQRDR